MFLYFFVIFWTPSSPLSAPLLCVMCVRLACFLLVLSFFFVYKFASINRQNREGQEK
jgi:hypothetical protein